MKYSPLLLAIPLLLSCTMPQKSDKKARPTKSYPSTFEHSMENITSTITGKIEVFDTTNAYLVEKWESRSRVSYKILGDKTTELLKMPDKIIVATGKISKTSRYSGTINISQYKIK